METAKNAAKEYSSKDYNSKAVVASSSSCYASSWNTFEALESTATRAGWSELGPEWPSLIQAALHLLLNMNFAKEDTRTVGLALEDK